MSTPPLLPARSSLATQIGEIFPPAGLRIAAGPLELRGIGPEEALALLEVVQAGIHPPEEMPFAFAWTDAPADQLPLNYLQWWASHITGFTRDQWALDMAIVWEGRIVGVQGVVTRSFLDLRLGETGSWLGMEFHGRGIGTAARRAWCTFLFEHLDFELITSAAVLDNAASRRISEKLGYRPNGSEWIAPRGERVEVAQIVLRPEDLTERVDLVTTGVPQLRRFLGLDAEPSNT